MAVSGLVDSDLIGRSLALFMSGSSSSWPIPSGALHSWQSQSSERRRLLRIRSVARDYCL